MKSPILFNGKVTLVNEINVTKIIEAYQNNYKIDVSTYFNNLNTISLYKCIDSGLFFFYPFNITGDTKFYEQLQEFDWYYMDWKWEHEVALCYITDKMSVLEIGCAKGTFLNKLSTNNVFSFGLELNEKAATTCKNIGLTVFSQTIQEHAVQFSEKYDVVCSFQVMEHISSIREVLIDSIAVLKKGGKLIISVPNNDSFLGLSINYLNLPPHHMSLWNEEVFLKISKIFNLKIVNIHLEPLQHYHKKYFIDTMTTYYLKKFIKYSQITNRIIPKIIPRIIRLFSKRTRAFTIVGVFEKE